MSELKLYICAQTFVMGSFFSTRTLHPILSVSYCPLQLPPTSFCWINLAWCKRPRLAFYLCEHMTRCSSPFCIFTAKLQSDILSHYAFFLSLGQLIRVYCVLVKVCNIDFFFFFYCVGALIWCMTVFFSFYSFCLMSYTECLSAPS